MKRVLLITTIFALISCFNINTSFAEETNSLDNKAPETLVYYNSWPGDHESPLSKNLKMSPKKPLNIYVLKDSNSQIIKTIQPGEFITLITADYHTFPSKSPVVILKEKSGLKPGDIIYLMGHIGGGDCLAWYDNNVIYVPADGIEDVKFYKEQRSDVPMWAKLIGQLPQHPVLWLYVKIDYRTYGWIKYDTYLDWQQFNHSIFTH